MVIAPGDGRARLAAPGGLHLSRSGCADGCAEACRSGAHHRACRSGSANHGRPTPTKVLKLIFSHQHVTTNPQAVKDWETAHNKKHYPEVVEPRLDAYLKFVPMAK